MRLLLALLFTACSGSSSMTDTGHDTAESSADFPTAVMITSDYQVGALATMNIETGTVIDTLSTVHADAAVSSGGDWVFQLNRLGMDSIRVYEPGQWSAPLVEFSTGDSSNPHDAVFCDNQIVVSLYAESHIALFEPTTGVQIDTIDLTQWADDDGSPEASSMVLLGDHIYVALQQFSDWESASGTVLQIDCSTLEILNEWATGPSPSLTAIPENDHQLLLNTGSWFEPDGTLQVLDTLTGNLQSPFLDEATLGQDLYGAQVTPDGTVVAIGYPINGADEHTLYCGHIDGRMAEIGPSLPNFVSALVSLSNDRVIGSAVAPWSGKDAPTGIFEFDPRNCTINPSEDWKQTLLPVTDIEIIGQPDSDA